MKKRIFLTLGMVVLLAVCVACKGNDKALESHCSIVVEYTDILDNMEALPSEKKEILISDGIVLENENATFKEGESAFDVLKRELTDKKIQFEFSKTPGLDSTYIEGIANIYQLDCGEMSGWLYYVNGESPSVSADEYIVKENDVIEWKYSTDMLKEF